MPSKILSQGTMKSCSEANGSKGWYFRVKPAGKTQWLKTDTTAPGGRLTAPGGLKAFEQVPDLSRTEDVLSFFLVPIEDVVFLCGRFFFFGGGVPIQDVFCLFSFFGGDPFRMSFVFSLFFLGGRGYPLRMSFVFFALRGGTHSGCFLSFLFFFFGGGTGYPLRMSDLCFFLGGVPIQDLFFLFLRRGGELKRGWSTSTCS